MVQFSDSVYVITMMMLIRLNMTRKLNAHQQQTNQYVSVLIVEGSSVTAEGCSSLISTCSGGSRLFGSVNAKQTIIKLDLDTFSTCIV